jgi:hypothetical protein
VRTHRKFLLGLGTALALGGVALLLRGPRAEATPLPKVRPFAAVVLTTPHDAEATRAEVRRIQVNAEGTAQKDALLGDVALPPGGVARGVLEKDDAAWVVADDDVRSDFGAVLYRVKGGATTRVASGVLHASRPLRTDSSALYIERGTAGTAPSAEEARAGLLREDTLTVDRVDGASLRSVYRTRGYATHLAGALPGQLVVYRVEPTRTAGSYGSVASVVLVDEVTGSSRTVADVPPFARDFSVQGSALYFDDRDAVDPTRWHVMRLDLGTGALEVVLSRALAAPAALATAGGIAVTADGTGGLVFSAAATPVHDARIFAPLGPGFYAPLDAVPGQGTVVANFTPARGYDVLVAMDPQGAAVRLSGADERLELLGVVGTNGGAR